MGKLKVRKFEELAESSETGFVPMSELFDIVIEEIYGEIELDPFVACKVNNDCCSFETEDEEGKRYCLVIGRNWGIDFWVDNLPLHFNRWALYKKLIEWKFLKSN
jgi:hypothetical protein